MTRRAAAARRVRFRLGNTRVTKIGAARLGWTDTYHWVLGLSWPWFFALVTLMFLALNGVFGALFTLQPGSIANARPGVFADHFFFSVHTLATVGYGNMYPVTAVGQVLVAVEILIGLISLATVTGLVFARFSAPHAKIMFSRQAVIAPFNGVPTLMLRAANERHNLILEASVKVTLNRLETTREGESFRRLTDLPLTRERTPAFSLTWTVMHAIDEASPFHRCTPERLAAEDAILMVSITGLDDVLHDTVHARIEYRASDIRVGERFVDILSREGDALTVDFTRFHDTQSIDPQST